MPQPGRLKIAMIASLLLLNILYIFEAKSSQKIPEQPESPDK
jgi:hypothetical protein